MKYPAILFAALYIVVRIVLFITGFEDNQYKYLVSLNLLFIVAAIVLAMYANYRSGKEQVLFPDEMKVAMRTVSTYAIILTIFTFVYYQYIDAGFAQRKIDVFQYELEQTDYSALPNIDNPLKVLGLSKEEFIEGETEKAASFLSPFSQATLTLVGIMVAGMVYSLALVFIRMKLLPFLFRKKLSN